MLLYAACLRSDLTFVGCSVLAGACVCVCANASCVCVPVLCRVERLDLAAASMIDTSKEVPLLNVSHQQPADSSTSTSTAAPAVARSQLQLVERE